MAKVINIGVRPEHIERRARILENAGHEVRNPSGITELEELLRAGAQVLVIGHNLDAPEKRRILRCMEQSGNPCAVVEMYMYVPELMTADAHVHWEADPDSLLEAVSRTSKAMQTRRVLHRTATGVDVA